jgi:multidrug resistance efflux pump
MTVLASLSSRPRWQLALGGLVIAGSLWLGLRPARATDESLTVTAKRGPLDINVLVGGSMEALESQEILCEVRGEPVKILKIVEEGYQVTEEDVKSKKVLAELDSSKLKQNLVSQEITFQGTQSALTEAQQGYEIQVNQNKTDIKAAEQKARFALMDLEKYLGARISADIVARLGLSEEVQSHAIPVDNSDFRVAPVDFAHYLSEGSLEDGAAKQELRKRADELLVARTTLSQADTKLDWTKQLFEKGYVTKSELETDQNSAEQARLRVDAALTAVDLFKKYEFPKMAEEALGKYDEALQGLIRARKEAVSRLAQAEAKLKGAEGRYQIEKQNRDELAEQIKSCELHAKTPGLVVYGGGSDRNYWGSNERIAVGAQVYERQPIITIPDQTKMGVNVGVHESHVMKVKKGQKAKITADAFPDDPLTGEVVKVGVLPDSQNRWMNPDLKLYSTRIAIEDKRDWMKPGMSAKIEIHVKRLDDVVYVPLQAISTREGKQVVFRPGAKPQPVEVEVGEFNDEFIEIKSGLAEGEIVLLRAPDAERPGADEPGSEDRKPGSEPSQPAPVKEVAGG